MYLVIHGRAVDDDDFTHSVASMFHQMPSTYTLLDALSLAGYTLVGIWPSEQQAEVDPPLLELGSDDNVANKNEFIETVDLYGAYVAMNALDLAEDILVRIQPSVNDPAEIEEAILEVLRLLREARDYVEAVCGDGDDSGQGYWIDDNGEGRDE